MIMAISCTNNRSVEPGIVFIDLDNIPSEAADLINDIESLRFLTLQLDSQSLIGNIQEIVFGRNCFYILCDKTKIIRYNNDGAYMSSIYQVGKGPGEYVQIDEIAIDPISEELFVADNMQRKVLRFKPNGDFIKEFKYKRSILAFHVTGKGILAMYLGRMTGRDFNPNDLFELAYFDFEGHRIAGYYPFEHPFPFGVPGGFTQGPGRKKTLFCKGLDYNIFEIKEAEEPQSIMQYDFGRYNADTSQIYNPAKKPRLSESNIVPFRYFSSLISTGSCFSINLRHNGKSALVLTRIADLKSKIYKLGSYGSIGSLYGFPIRTPYAALKDEFVSIYPIEFIERIMEDLSEDQIKELSKFKGFNQAEQLTLEDNPVLVFYSFKDF